MPKEKAPCKYLSIIMIGSVIKVNKKYYPQTLLEECKYTQEKIKIEDYISEDFEDSGCDSNLIVNLIVILIMRANLILVMKNSLLK